MSDYHVPKPCPGCPFSRGEKAVRGLTAKRLAEIVASDGGFICHQTDSKLMGSEKLEPKECAGFLIFNLVNETAPQMMRIAGRTGGLDIDALLEHAADVITDLDELIELHETFNHRANR